MSGAPLLRSAQSVCRLPGRRRFHPEVVGRLRSDLICRPDLAVSHRHRDPEVRLGPKPESEARKRFWCRGK